MTQPPPLALVQTLLFEYGLRGPDCMYLNCEEGRPLHSLSTRICTPHLRVLSLPKFPLPVRLNFLNMLLTFLLDTRLDVYRTRRLQLLCVGRPSQALVGNVLNRVRPGSKKDGPYVYRHCSIKIPFFGPVRFWQLLAALTLSLHALRLQSSCHRCCHEAVLSGSPPPNLYTTQSLDSTQSVLLL